MLTTLFQY